jgi:hypothetical protein
MDNLKFLSGIGLPWRLGATGSCGEGLGIARGHSVAFTARGRLLNSSYDIQFFFLHSMYSESQRTMRNCTFQVIDFVYHFDSCFGYGKETEVR